MRLVSSLLSSVVDSVAAVELHPSLLERVHLAQPRPFDISLVEGRMSWLGRSDTSEHALLEDMKGGVCGVGLGD